MKLKSVRYFLWSVFISLSVFSCSTAEIDDNDPVAMMKDAEDDISSGHYLIAIDKLQLIKNKHPYSKQATEAQLRLADVYFLQENYAEAAATYEAFVDLHPKSDQVAYALYRQGLSYFEDSPENVARDQTSSLRALEVFEVFLKKFPKHDLIKEAVSKLTDVKQRLAGKEMYIANYYFKRGFWEAAKIRFQKVVSSYPELKFAKEAEVKITISEKKMEEKRIEEQKIENEKRKRASE